MTPEDRDIDTVIPDLSNISLARLAELGPSVLAKSIARHRERQKDSAHPLNSFQARI
jgi:hypothetical protein